MGRGGSSSYRRPDRFTRQAKDEGYAARSVFKLKEIDQRARVLGPGQRVVDLGCFPGSWSRYVLERIGPSGALVGVDLDEPALAGGTWLVKSVLDVTPEELQAALGGPADVVLSDMAHATAGTGTGDHYAQMELAQRAFELAVALLVPGGAFVCKVFEGPDAAAFQAEARRAFSDVRRIRPEAVRKESREWFLVAKGFKG